MLSFFVLVLSLLITCILHVITSQADGHQAAAASAAMEDRVNKAMTILNDPSQTGNDVEALGHLEEAIRLFQEEASRQQQSADASLIGTALNVYSNTGSVYQAIAQQQLEPTSHTSLAKAEKEYFLAGLDLIRSDSRELFGPAAEAYFLEQLGTIKTLQRQECRAATDYFLPLWRDHAKEKLANLSNEIRLLVVSTIGSCYPEQGVLLWERMLTEQYLTVREAEQCKSCWSYIMVANARSGGSKQAVSTFQALSLDQYTPYKHALQVPSSFNSALATKSPEPFMDKSAYGVCRALESSKADIIDEYNAYHRAVKLGKRVNIHEEHHVDDALAEDSGGGWDQLFLRRTVAVDTDENGDGGIDWQEHRCNSLFPRTCAALRGLAELANPVKGKDRPNQCSNHKNRGYPQWCGSEDFAGSVGFYSLQPNTSVRLHTGTTNSRLKCHLIISAPTGNASNDEGWSWLEVGEVRRKEVAGDVIAFDDSFLHRVWNEGDAERVILDVAFWHPDLISNVKLNDREL